MNSLRPDLPPLPANIAKLPVSEQGYPVPWFVAWVDGKPDFRCVRPGRTQQAMREDRCWICGEELPATFGFVVGPMCAVNRVSAEPPSHLDCCTFAAQACPFLIRPRTERRETDLPAGTVDPPGTMIKRNPGVVLVWVTNSYTPFPAGGRGILFKMGRPRSLQWWREGRIATPTEVNESIESGLPILRGMAQEQGPAAVAELEKIIQGTMELISQY